MIKMASLSVSMIMQLEQIPLDIQMLAGCGKYLENLVRNRLGVKARSVELNVHRDVLLL